MQDEIIDAEAEKVQQTLRPVMTPLDGQASRHKQLKTRMMARPRREEKDLGLDLSLLRPEPFVPLEFDYDGGDELEYKEGKSA